MILRKDLPKLYTPKGTTNGVNIVHILQKQLDPIGNIITKIISSLNIELALEFKPKGTDEFMICEKDEGILVKLYIWDHKSNRWILEERI